MQPHRRGGGAGARSSHLFRRGFLVRPCANDLLAGRLTHRHKASEIALAPSSTPARRRSSGTKGLRSTQCSRRRSRGDGDPRLRCVGWGPLRTGDVDLPVARLAAAGCIRGGRLRSAGAAGGVFGSMSDSVSGNAASAEVTSPMTRRSERVMTRNRSRARVRPARIARALGCVDTRTATWRQLAICRSGSPSRSPTAGRGGCSVAGSRALSPLSSKVR